VNRAQRLRGRSSLVHQLCTVTLGLQAAAKDFSIPSFTSGLSYLTLCCRGRRNSDYCSWHVKPLNDDDERALGDPQQQQQQQLIGSAWCDC